MAFRGGNCGQDVVETPVCEMTGDILNVLDPNGMAIKVVKYALDVNRFIKQLQQAQFAY